MTLALPEDPGRWPRDPHQLLGVAPGAAQPELRRAYTRLIRIYKPEQHPEQFRRIREAYEFLLMFASAEPVPADEPLPPSALDTAPVPDHEMPCPAADPVTAAWEQACDGQEVAAYQALRQLAEAQPARGEVCIRLYWLLTLAPELDPGRAPCDWLVEALRGGELNGPARALYQRELLARPAEALEQRWTTLLDCPAPPTALADLLEQRWHAASRLGRLVTTLTTDLPAVRERLRPDGGVIWFHLLLRAVELLAWSMETGTEELIGSCYEEIEHQAKVYHQFQEQLNELDYLLELAAAWEDAQQEGIGPPELLALVRLSFSRSAEDYHERLQRFLGQVAAAPLDHLTQLDRLRERYPSLLSQFGRMLQQMSYHVHLPRDPRAAEKLASILLDMVDLSHREHYQDFRRRLLAFCIWENLSPEWVAHALADRAEYIVDDRYLAQVVHDDGPLHYIWQAQRLFWA